MSGSRWTAPSVRTPRCLTRSHVCAPRVHGGRVPRTLDRLGLRIVLVTPPVPRRSTATECSGNIVLAKDTGWQRAIQIVQPATVVRWHREALALHWRWKSRRQRAGRPNVAGDIRDLIRHMNRANPLWGAPRIHGELLKLGIEVSQATVAKYIPRRHTPPSPTWRSFLVNHVQQLALIDFFTVPTTRGT